MARKRGRKPSQDKINESWSEGEQEEVLRLEIDDSSDASKEEYEEEIPIMEDSEAESHDKSDSEQETGWGSRKRDYYGANEAENLDDLLLEQEEALKLQKLQLSRLSEQDFFDDILLDSSKTSEYTEKQKIDRQLTTENKIRFLKAQYPELDSMINDLQMLLEQKKNSELDCCYLINLGIFFALKWSQELTSDLSNLLLEDLKHLKELWLQYSEQDKSLSSVDNEESVQDKNCHESDTSRRKEDQDMSKDEIVQSINCHKDVTIQDMSCSKDETVRNIICRKDDTIQDKDLKPKLLLELDMQEIEKKIQDTKQTATISKKKQSLVMLANQIQQKSLAKQYRIEADADLPYVDPIERLRAVQMQAAAAAAAAASESQSDEEYQELPIATSTKKQANLVEANQIENQKGDKRAISYEIASNKGLTPKRPKENRNPRVKKRLKYSKAVKKLSSQKAIYQGKPQSHYGGEMTGIKANLIRSVKF